MRPQTVTEIPANASNGLKEKNAAPILAFVALRRGRPGRFFRDFLFVPRVRKPFSGDWKRTGPGIREGVESVT